MEEQNPIGSGNATASVSATGDSTTIGASGGSLPATSLFVTGDIDDQFLEMLENAGLLRRSGGLGAGSAVEGSSKVCADTRSASVDLERAADILRHDESTHLVLFYKALRQHLGEAIRNDQSLLSTIEAWKDYARKILQLYRRYRRRITLIDSQTALLAPNEAIEVVARRAAIDREKSFTAPSSDAPAAIDDLLAIIAFNTAQEDYDLNLLVKELDAGSALQLHAEEPDSARLLRNLREERREARQRDAENELLLLQLQQLQVELEAYFDRSSGLESELQTLRGIERDLRKQTDALLKSSSWKVTAPLRWLRSLVGTARD